MPPAPPSNILPDNVPPPGSANPPGTSSLCGIKEDEPSTAADEDVQIYLELWQEVLANTLASPFEGNGPFDYLGPVTEDDSHSTLRNHLVNLGMPEVTGTAKILFSYLQAAIDEQSWPFIPYIRETHLVPCEKFPHQPDILIGCEIRSYALNQRTGTLKLLTLRGIVTITTLSERGIGNIGIDPNIKHALNSVNNGGRRKIIRKASFARRKGNGSNAPQCLVFGLRIGKMAKMGFIFCKDPEEPNSGPTGHVTLRYSTNMTDDALNRRGSSDRSKKSGSFRGPTTSDLVPGPATVRPACCPYCSKGYAAMEGLILHLLRMLEYPSASDVKHPEDEISDFIRNTGKHIAQRIPVHSAKATKAGSQRDERSASGVVTTD